MFRFLTPLLVALSLFATGTEAAVTLDANGSQGLQNSSVTSFDYTGITVGSISHGALLCGVGWGAVVSSVAMTWDNGGTNQAMTRIGTLGNTIQTDLWGLVAPTAGNKTLHITWTTSTSMQVVCVSFSGVDQTGGTTTFYNATTASGTSTTAAVTCTSVASGDEAVDSDAANGFNNGVNGSQTTINNTNGGVAVNEAMSRVDGTGANIAFGWTFSASSSWAEVCTAIKQFVAAANMTPQRMLTGYGQ